MPSRLAAAVCLSCFVTTAWAADTQREALYDIVGDFDHDGTPDRAVLIVEGPGMTPDDSDLAKDRYWLQDDEQLDLAIYLGAGNVPLDITKPPSFEKDNINDHSRNFDWAVPLEVNKAGALKVTTSEGWGSSHENDETLTIQVNKSVPLLIGYDLVWELPGADSASCSIDLQKGNAIKDDGTTKKKFKVKAVNFAFKDWKQPLWDKICSP